MKDIKKKLPLLLILLTGCASNPVLVSCPKFPEAPIRQTESVSIEIPLIDRYKSIEIELLNSLEKAAITN